MTPRTVLIVDDDKGAIETFTLMLRAAGYRVSAAADGESALDKVGRERPAAVIVDLHLPGIDGLEFVRRLRSSCASADPGVAVVTGNYQVEDEVRAELDALGAKLFFKPLWEDDLNRIVRALVRAGGSILPVSMSNPPSIQIA